MSSLVLVRHDRNKGRQHRHSKNGSAAHHIQLAGEVRGTTVLCFALVCWVVLEERSLALQRSSNGLFGIDVALSTVNHRDVA
jgi:hypothetical protein